MHEKYPGIERRKSVLTEQDREFFASIATPKEKRFFGFKIQELAIIGSILLTMTGFYFGTRDSLERLVSLGEYTKAFMENSDSYHSAVLGTSFKQGKPSNPSYDVKPIRDIFVRENK